MKPNFVLTRSSYGTFLKRFNALLSKTGVLSQQGFYKKRNKIQEVYEKLGDKRGQVLQTVKHFIEKNRTETNFYPWFENLQTAEGILIKVNADCVITILWGQKMHFAPNQITLIGDPEFKQKAKLFNANCGLVEVFKPYYDAAFASRQNEFEEQYAKDYYEQCMNDMYDEEIKEMTFANEIL